MMYSERSRMMIVGLLLTLFGAALGCAATAPHASRDAFAEAVEGPGVVFASIEDAAVDALAWSYVQSRRDRRAGRVRAGVISPVQGGYTYSEVVTAPVLDPARVSFRLVPGDVAHFRYIPSGEDRGASHAGQGHTPADRELVDVLDPLHRVSYRMSVDRVVRVYAGNGDEFVLGTVDDWIHRSPRWGKRPVVRVTELSRGG